MAELPLGVFTRSGLDVILRAAYAQTCHPRTRHVLFAGTEVAAWLLASSAEAARYGRGDPRHALALLTGVDIIEPEDMPPAQFRLVAHTACRVLLDEEHPERSGVSHDACLIEATGTLVP